MLPGTIPPKVTEKDPALNLMHITTNLQNIVDTEAPHRVAEQLLLINADWRGGSSEIGSRLYNLFHGVEKRDCGTTSWLPAVGPQFALIQVSVQAISSHRLTISSSAIFLRHCHTPIQSFAGVPSSAQKRIRPIVSHTVW
jgi:hypothetical protein